MPIWHQTRSMWSCICDLIYDPEPKGTQTADSESHSNWAESFCVFRQSIAWDSKVLTFFQERATVCCKRVFLWLEHIHAGSECCLLLLALLYATDEITSLQLQFGWLPCFHFSWNVAFSSCKDDDLSTQAVPFSPSLDELKTHRCGSLRALKADIWRLERLPLPLPTPAGCVARRDISDLDSYQYHPTHAQTLSAASVLPEILCTQTLVIKWC